MRFLNAADTLRRERDRDLRTIAFHTDVDRRAWFVRESDEVYSLGPAIRRDATGSSRHAYLDLAGLAVALQRTRADAAWVGWGFVAEDPAFAELCERLGVTFIGPPAPAMRRLGDKIEAKRVAEAAGVPVAPWSGGPVDEATAPDHGASIGYPLLVKAAAGGGGRGIRVVAGPDELGAGIAAARAEAQSSFGDDRVFLEALVPTARHVEVQVAVDDAGTAWALGVRDCSVQRRRQKVIEESASTALAPDAAADIADAAVRLCRRAGYRNLGTVEFLVRPDGSYAFMEVNARLQVEHTVTEATTGLDLVRLQLDLAAGERLDGRSPAAHGHAIEVRLNAEDPNRGFAPAPGRITELRLPQGPGIRVDAGVTEGDVIAPEFDSMIAKVIAWGPDRGQALARLHTALGRAAVVIDGGATNRPLLLALLAHPDLRAGRVDTTWLDRCIADGSLVGQRYGAVALVTAAIETYERQFVNDVRHFLSTARRGRPDLRREVGVGAELTAGGVTRQVRVHQIDAHGYRVGIAAEVVEVSVERLGRHERRLRSGVASWDVLVRIQGSDHVVEVGGEAHRIQAGDAGTIRAPAPAVVVAVPVSPGDVVEAGQAVAVLESMKMETVVTTATSGKVRDVAVRANAQVDAGDVLVRLDSSEDVAEGDRSDRSGAITLAADFEPSIDSLDDVPGRSARARALRRLRDVMLGFDREPDELAAVLGVLGRAPAAAPSSAPDLGEAVVTALEDEVLAVFTDICALASRRPTMDIQGRAPTRGDHEHFLAFLRSPERAGAILPDEFLGRLESLVARYGRGSLEPTDEAAADLLRVYRGVKSVPDVVAHVVRILDRRLRAAGAPAVEPEASSVAALDRLIAAAEATQPAVAEAARAVRYRWVEEPVLEQVRRSAAGEVDAALAQIALEGADRRPESFGSIVDTPRHIEPHLLRRLWTDDSDRRAIVLEALLRRVNGDRRFEAVWPADRRWPLLVGRYTKAGGPGVVVGGAADLDGLADLARSAASVARDAVVAAGAPARSVDHDLVVRVRGPVTDIDRLAGLVRAHLLAASAGYPDGGRFNVTIQPGEARGGPARHVSFVVRDGDVTERPVFRDLPPALARRLELWRFRDFDLERLPSVDGVHLYRAVARTNGSDERLFALAEVHDLTPSALGRDEPAAWPDLERTMVEALASIREARVGRALTDRPVGNRIVLYVRPPWTVPVDELRRLAHKFAPSARGLGLEKVILRVRMPAADGDLRSQVLHMTSPTRVGVSIGITDPSPEPIRALTPSRQALRRTRVRGDTPPGDVILMLTAPSATNADFPVGTFTELDLDDQGRLVPVERSPGANPAGVVVGTIRNVTERYPEGMRRVIVIGDPGHSLGALAEPECRRIVAAIDLADRLSVPVEWFAVSSGARVAMDSGVENMDWTAAVLRRIVHFTQSGGEINVVLTGVNVGAQSYWDAEATMVMHTRGVLIVTGDASMVLTGKHALDVSGAVSADDNAGIGGYHQVMGPNGEATLWAPTLEEAASLLFAHYELTYVAPGESGPRRLATLDAVDRDVRGFPHPARPDSDFRTVGDVFSALTNPDRKKPFDIRSVMRAVVDQDHPPLERWPDWRGAATAVVWDASMGGHSVRLIGVESRILERLGPIPADGPERWAGGTLYPLSSKKVARAINGATGQRPVVILANLSGFDGSPESMRELQLEYGAEIGRAMVNFRGPVVLCVISRYHGGAFVVFSKALNPNLEVAAVEGSFASVLGGAPAAAVVFSREVDARVRSDPRVVALTVRVEGAPDGSRDRLRAELDDLVQEVRSEILGRTAAEFDEIHTIERARAVGAVDRVIRAADLRPYLVGAIERGITRTQTPGPARPADRDPTSGSA